MNSAKLCGLILIGVGVIALVYQGFSYTTREKVVDFGPIHGTNEEKHTFPMPPVIGAIAFVAGLGLLVFAGKKS
jgi:hypothetical protein